MRVATVKLAGARTLLAVPMLKEGQSRSVPSCSIARRCSPFTDKQIELVKTFAAQAVIAIENTRLLNEVSAHAISILQQQTATADVLKVISSLDLRSADSAAHAMLNSAARLCDADSGHYYAREKWRFLPSPRPTASHREFMDYVRTFHIEPERGSASGRALLEGRLFISRDVKADPEYTWSRRSDWAISERFLASPCCARAFRSAC